MRSRLKLLVVGALASAFLVPTAAVAQASPAVWAGVNGGNPAEMVTRAVADDDDDDDVRLARLGKWYRKDICGFCPNRSLIIIGDNELSNQDGTVNAADLADLLGVRASAARHQNPVARNHDSVERHNNSVVNRRELSRFAPRRAKWGGR
ncbi:hypothetical protein ACFXJ8_08360 [Nonomuraea sp. NPDC059194]|uniref:hypothetical protein n=1 Tax=Nonomuraea sp. NPDC059194 TaxID=3346764 RepID=UPI00369FE320